MKKLILISVCIIMLTVNISAFGGDYIIEEPLRTEHTRSFYLNREELDELEDYMYTYMRSVTDRTVDPLIETGKNILMENLIIKIFNKSIGQIATGLNLMFSIVNETEYSLVKEYAVDGYDAARRARNDFLDIETIINRRVYEAEIKFEVYTRWDNYDVEMVSGGGKIVRVRVDGGWMSSGEVQKLIERYYIEHMKNNIYNEKIIQLYQ